MFRTDDIYLKVGKKLMEHDYYEKNIEEQKELIELELKNYIISKLEELNIKVTTNLSIYELLSILSQKLDNKNKEELLPFFTHFILSIIESKQKYGIIWYIEDNTSLIENPILIFNKKNLCDKLLTHKNTDYYKTFCYVYDTFKNKMFLKEKTKKFS